jgi:voltage-gated potassium channel
MIKRPLKGADPLQQRKRTFLIFYLLIAIIIVGTIGYSLLLNISLMDTIYMTVITMSIVGFQEVAPMTAQG